MPGGLVEPGEAPADGARREFEEETGIRVSGPIDVLFSSRNDRLHYVGYEAVIAHEVQPRLDHEHRAWGWFVPGRLPEPLHPGLRGVRIW